MVERNIPEVYPRVGGGNYLAHGIINPGDGLSPRGRGKLITVRASDNPSRSIPAWAGETRAKPTAAFHCAVYPRVGGGNVLKRGYCARALGLSPRGRGKQGPPFFIF